MVPDWRIAAGYEPIARAERKALAWEWLRRSDRYNQVWLEFKDTVNSKLSPQQFGLERFVDPALAIPIAKPVWRAEIDPAVITASVSIGNLEEGYHVDLFHLKDFTTIAIDLSADEHILLTDGVQTLRLDIVEGTLLGCPARLRFMLGTHYAMRIQLRALQQLLTMSVTGRFGRSDRSNRILDRWIAELRVADALRSNANQYEIAKALFGPMISKQNWRAESDGYRLRVQRLARKARKRLQQPLDREWFT